MDLRTIISISGSPGLYRIISHSRTGVIVESMLDKKRSMISANQRINSLDNISVFTTEKDILLEEVFVNMKAAISASVDTKQASDDLKKLFKSVLPDYDQDRVHDSDIKKMFSWFNILITNDDVWAEKKDDDNSPAADLKAAMPMPGDKPKKHASKESGRVNTHGASGSRSAIPQKKGGG
jgi:hypothetical protein